MTSGFSDLTSLLAALPGMDDAELSLASAALVLGATPGLNLDRYHHYLNGLGPRVADLYRASDPQDLAAQGDALRRVLHAQDGFVGDDETYDALDNALLPRVIDRRRGLPITLGILYLHAARASGMSAEGLNFPGHFLIRLVHGGQRLILDPFHGGCVMGAPDLRALLKKMLGPGAELDATYTSAVTNRDLLIRLQNNVKKRQIEAEDYAAALRTIETMRLIDPAEYRLHLDAGVLYAKLGQVAQAREHLVHYRDHFPVGHPNRREAEQILAMMT